MIYIDEAHFKLESQACKRGRVSKQRWCDSCSKFKNGAKGVSLLMSVSGYHDNPFGFHQQLFEGGTDL